VAEATTIIERTVRSLRKVMVATEHPGQCDER
jgi:hypothetical protein